MSIMNSDVMQYLAYCNQLRILKTHGYVAIPYDGSATFSNCHFHIKT